MRLDFGDHEVNKDKLKKMFGWPSKSSKKQGDVMYNIETNNKIFEYLENSDYPFPLIKFFNEQYVYIHILKNHKRSNFIYNRKTKKSFLQTADSPSKLSLCLDIKDNILFGMTEAYEIDQYTDRQYMSEENLKKMEKIEEEDNPVIIEYHLW
jgi:hypothetical protein